MGQVGLCKKCNTEDSDIDLMLPLKSHSSYNYKVSFISGNIFSKTFTTNCDSEKHKKTRFQSATNRACCVIQALYRGFSFRKQYFKQEKQLKSESENFILDYIQNNTNNNILEIENKITPLNEEYLDKIKSSVNSNKELKHILSTTYYSSYFQSKIKSLNCSMVSNDVKDKTKDCSVYNKLINLSLNESLIIYDDLSFYYGQLNILNERHGFGYLISNNNKYHGSWVYNEFTGYGRHIDDKGFISEGKYIH